MSEAQPPVAESATAAAAPAAPVKPLSLMQMLYDDVFLMLLLGLVVPFLFYTIWGFIELMSVPLAG